MPVLTCDILLEGMQRDVLFERLCLVSTHISFFKKSKVFIKENATDHLELEMPCRFKRRRVGYVIDKRDDDHGGRRISIKTTGKRSAGLLSYSLRTMKPSRNTLITLTWDYNPGGVLGNLIDAASLRESYTLFLKDTLASLVREIKGE